MSCPKLDQKSATFEIYKSFKSNQPCHMPMAFAHGQKVSLIFLECVAQTFWALANTIGISSFDVLKISKIAPYWPNLSQNMQLIPGKPLE